MTTEDAPSTAIKDLDFPERTPALIRKACARPATVALLMVVAAIYYGSEILTVERAEYTRISEHALMPGIVLPQFNQQAEESRFLQGARQAEKKNILVDFIVAELEAHAIEASEHLWKRSSLFSNMTGRSAVAVVRAERASGAESMAVFVRLQDTRAVSMAMALAVHARGHSYWARDIFFVFVDGSLDGGALAADSWLRDYFGTVPREKSAGATRLPRGQFMVGAVVLEIVPYLQRRPIAHVLLSGLNGQLPNLDLFNTVARISARGNFRMNVMIYPTNAEALRVREHEIPVRFLLTQAFTAVEGVHSVFGQYGVQALTLRMGTEGTAGQPTAERLVELVLRSLNNLHERFHQSYFLYILVSPMSFVSIAFYTPLVGLLLAPLLICALREWFLLRAGALKLPIAIPTLALIGIGEYLALPVVVKFSALDEETTVKILLALLVLPYGLVVPLARESAGAFRFLLLVASALLLASLSLLNFGLGLLSAAVALLPLVVITTYRSRTRLSSLSRSLLLALFHPLSLLLLGQLALYSLDNGTAWWNRLDSAKITHVLNVEAPSRLLTTLARLLHEDTFFSSWHLRLLCIAAGPVWNCLLALASTVEGGPDEEEKKLKKE